MNQTHFLINQNEHWRKIPSEKIEIFSGMLGKLPPSPKNPICMNLYHAVSCFIQDYQNNQQIKQMFARVKELNRIEDIPKTKGRLCGGLLKKGDKAYRCYNCMTEDNSVLCEKCFQLERHIGHDFERFDVHGGCCDCGDIQKWKEQTFCTEHCKDEEVEVMLNENLVNLFLQEQLYGLQILLEMYSRYESFRSMIEGEDWNLSHMGDIQSKLKNTTIAKAAKLVDLYGGVYIDQLVEFNKAGKFANAMTDIFFKKQLTFEAVREEKVQTVTNTVFLHLFSMTQLRLTPEKMSDLCITMFPMVGFREAVTEIYISLYNRDPSFPPSAYTHLSSQLLTSYIAITKLIKEGRINALKYQPQCKSEKDIQKIAEGYIRYYYDIKYLSKLYGDASIHYLRLHGQQKMFHSLGYYRIIFDSFPKAIDYYGIQQIYLERMITLTNAIQTDKTNEISNMILRQLYKFITTAQTSAHNKFRPQERLFTLALFVRYNGDLSFLDDPVQVQELLSILGVEHFQKEAFQIITNICSLLKTAAGLIDGNQSIHHVYTFYSFYLRKSQLLFSLDAILLKIALKLCQHYQKSKPFFDYRSFLLESSSKDPYFIIKEEFDEAVDDAMPLLNNIINLKNYISLVTQAIFSDLPILSVSCALLPKDSQRISLHKIPKLINHQLALHYYECLLRSQDVGRIAIKTFKKEAELFFKEQETFRVFVDKCRDSIDPLKLVKREEQGLGMNYLYFRSICSIPAEKYKNGNCAPPYMKWKKDQAIDIFLGKIQSSVKFILNNMQKDGLIIPQIANCKLIPGLIIQLWKISIFSQSHQSSQMLQRLLNTIEVQKQIQHLGKDILTALHRTEYHQDQMQEKRRQDLRKKLQDKKALILKKMNKNAEKILQSESFKSSEAPEMKSQDQAVCCLCKEINSEHLYLLGFTTFTNGNGWLAMDKTKNLIPIFETCGHAVHRQCYVKIMTQNNLNRLYLFCPLCKKSTNILMPDCEVLDKEAQQLFVGYLYQIYHTLEIPETQNALLNGLCKSLVFELVFKGLGLPEEFIKNVKVYRTIYQVYSKMNQHYQKGKQTLTQQDKDKELVLEVGAPQILKDIFGYITSMINHQASNAKLSQSCIERLQALSAILQNKQPLISEVEPYEANIIRSSVVFPIIEESLAELNSKYRGKCLQCGLVTNNQMICLNCPKFVACTNCSKSNLMEHSKVHHAGMAVFIRTSTGDTFYIMRNRYWRFQSLYEDYMGRAYDGCKMPREDYKLNISRFQATKRDVLLMKIEQKVRFKENETKKVFNQEIT